MVNDSKIEALTTKLEKRAARLRKLALAYLFVIGFLLVLGSFIFFFAADITASDIQSSDTSLARHKKSNILYKEKEAEIQLLVKKGRDIVKEYRNNNEKLVNFLLIEEQTLITEVSKLCEIDEILDLQSVEKVAARMGRPDAFMQLFSPIDFPDMEGPHKIKIGTFSKKITFKTEENKKNCMALLIKEFPHFTAPAILRIGRSGTSKELDDRLIEKRQELKNLGKLRESLALDVLRGKVLGEERVGINNKNHEIPALIQTNITRFGGLLTIFFLVNILLSQYRYNMKLSAFYIARVDALMLGDDDFDQLIVLFGALTPSIDYSKTPKSPIVEVIDSAKTFKYTKT